jgi:hypothetical protein
MLPPLRELITDRADALAGGGGGCGGAESESAVDALAALSAPPARAALAATAAGVFAALPTRAKHHLLSAERARAAAAAEPPWVAALARWGFVRLGLLPRVPAAELAAALSSAYPVTAPRGATLAVGRARALADAMPPEGVAAALASVLAFWLAGSPRLQAALHVQCSTFDAAFQRSPTDPRGLVPPRGRRRR